MYLDIFLFNLRRALTLCSREELNYFVLLRTLSFLELPDDRIKQLQAHIVGEAPKEIKKLNGYSYKVDENMVES
ncbi:hypothetical protein MUP77_06755 [Candidatus Bathyarchaeota archaeon]|nr:hypothetical protein [Candidatus Bathyarchaeota archaeon]